MLKTRNPLEAVRLPAGSCTHSHTYELPFISQYEIGLQMVLWDPRGTLQGTGFCFI